MAKGIQVINKQVTTAGTAVAIQTSTANPKVRFAQSLVFTAPAGNTGTVYVGTSGVTNGATGTGFPIAKGTTVSLSPTFFGSDARMIDLTTVFVNADTNNDRLVVMFDAEL